MSEWPGRLASWPTGQMMGGFGLGLGAGPFWRGPGMFFTVAGFQRWILVGGLLLDSRADLGPVRGGSWTIPGYRRLGLALRIWWCPRFQADPSTRPAIVRRHSEVYNPRKPPAAM